MFKSCISKAKSFFKNEKGATMVEYGIVVALIAAVCVAVITTVGTDLQTVFSNVDSKLKTVVTAAGS